MSVIDSLLNYIGQYNTGMQTLGNSSYNNLLNMINQAASQNTFNTRSANNVSGRETRVSNQQANQNNLALLNALIGSGYGTVSGSMGNISSILPYLFEMDPEYQSALRRNYIEAQRLADAAEGFANGNKFVGGTAIMQGSSPGATGAIIGSPNWASFSKGWGEPTYTNKLENDKIANNYARSNAWNTNEMNYPVMSGNKARNMAAYLLRIGKKSTTP